MKLKVNDNVKVMAGKDKGKTGKVTRVLPKEEKVIVAGVNLYKRHMKKRDAQNPGGVVEIERPLNVSKVALLVGDKVTRVGYHVSPTGEKVRIARKTGDQIDKK